MEAPGRTCGVSSLKGICDMADKFDAATRSYIMSRIRGKWTNPERQLHNHLKGSRVRHNMHPKIFGNPDAYLKDLNAVVFVDGCFWHGCPEHGHIPKSKKGFWKAKIDRNTKRDRAYTKELRSLGYNVIRIWECQIKDGSWKQRITSMEP